MKNKYQLDLGGVGGFKEEFPASVSDSYESVEKHVLKYRWNKNQKDWLQQNCKDYEIFLETRERAYPDGDMIKFFSLWIRFNNEEEELLFIMRWL